MLRGFKRFVQSEVKKSGLEISDKGKKAKGKTLASVLTFVEVRFANYIRGANPQDREEAAYFLASLALPLKLGKLLVSERKFKRLPMKFG